MTTQHASPSWRTLAAGAVAGTAFGLCATSAGAIAFDAGDYVPAPAGTQLAILYMQYGHSDSLYASGEKASSTAKLDTYVGIARYVGYGNIGGIAYDYQLLQPFGRLEGGGSTASLGNTTNIGDTILVGTVWLHNDPAHKSYFGFTPYLYIPDGAYDKNRGLNLGEHRWKTALQGVGSRGFGDHWVMEGAADVTFFGDNNDAASATGLGSVRKKEDNLYSFQGFARYLFDAKNEVNLRMTYSFGGETSLADVRQQDEEVTTAALGTYRHTFDSGFQVLFQGGRDIAVRNGFKEGVRLQTRFLKAF